MLGTVAAGQFVTPAVPSSAAEAPLAPESQAVARQLWAAECPSEQSVAECRFVAESKYPSSSILIPEGSLHRSQTGNDGVKNGQKF